MLRRATSLVAAMSMMCMTPNASFASSHREAPITALDHPADITDFYAFVSYDHPDRVTFVMTSIHSSSQAMGRTTFLSIRMFSTKLR